MRCARAPALRTSHPIPRTVNLAFEKRVYLIRHHCSAVRLQFFAWRVQVLRKQWWLTAIIVFFCASGLIGSMATVIGYAVIPEGAYFTNLYVMQPAMLVWSCCFVTCDSITTGTLVYTLRKAVQGFHSDTDSRIESIKNLVLQTSSLTMVVDMIHLLIVAIRVRRHPLSVSSVPSPC